MRAQRKQGALTLEDERLFVELDRQAERRVVFWGTAISVGVAASIMDVDLAPALVLSLIAGSVPLLALTFTWR